MKSEMSRITLKERLEECAKHEEKIIIARRHLAPLMPLTTEGFKSLDEIQSGFVDQLVYRFSKLQDTLGDRVFPAILLMSKEEVKGKTFLDILHRIEELQIAEADAWIQLRELRNEIAHEYSENANEVVDALNAIFEKSEQLLGFYHGAREFVKIKFNLQIIEEG